MYIIFDIPRAPDFGKTFLQYQMNVLFLRQISPDYSVAALFATYMRLVDAALNDYALGDTKLKEFWGSTRSINMGAIHRSVVHFETCITHMHRAVLCFRRLRRNRASSSLLKTILGEERPLFVDDRIAKRIRDMRNCIHHVEEDLIKGRLKAGDSFMIRADGPELPKLDEPGQTEKTIDRLILGPNEVKFSELVAWLDNMGLCAQRITSHSAKAPV